jgi:AAA+ ATPase superfamily predicted ATPase
MKIIGRKEEQEWLKQYYESKFPELVVVLGRRRVGKTYLIKQYFKEDFFFYYTGVENKNKDFHLNNFKEALEIDIKIDTWTNAFNALKFKIQNSIQLNKKIIFIDEFPWLETPNSDFLASFDYFWNSFASTREDCLFIICGSSTTWITNNIFNSHGGLYNRATGKITLAPFTLQETEEYFELIGYKTTKQSIIEAYMVFGGIPYYLKYFNSKFSFPQNVDRILFSKGAPLTGEYTQIYKSLFGGKEIYEKIINQLSQKTAGLTRSELAKILNIGNGGYLSKILEDLEISGFVRKYNNFPNKKRESLYQLIDFFFHFHKNFITTKSTNDPNYFQKEYNLDKYNAWKGFAFERVCMTHTQQIKKALNILSLSSEYAWKNNNSQIDLVIYRNDRVINLCEIKFYNKEFSITPSYRDTLLKKKEEFSKLLKKSYTLHMTIISTFGMKFNEYSNIFQSEVKMDDLFK